MPAIQHEEVQATAGTTSAIEKVEQATHVSIIRHTQCQRDENATECDFSQCLVRRRDQPEGQPRIGTTPPNARCGIPERMPEGTGTDGGFLKPDPACRDKALG